MTDPCAAFLACILATGKYNPDYVHQYAQDGERAVIVLDAPADHPERIMECVRDEPAQCEYHHGEGE